MAKTPENETRGRPALPENERRRNFLRVRLSDDELAKIQAAAASKGESVSDYARGVLTRSAARSR